MGAEETLKLLRQSSTYVSGEKISSSLKLSRTAVWKHIQSLRAMGYDIKAVRNRGYLLVDETAVLSPDKLQARLDEAGVPVTIDHTPSLPSTQTKAMRLAAEGAPAYTVVSADEQTGGRGRLGRPWSTPFGTALAISIIFRPEMDMREAPTATLTAAAAVAEALEEMNFRPQIKWPNDILLNGKKVCGILTEMQGEASRVSSLVMGIGINVNTEQFPEQLQEIATSLAIVRGAPVSREETAFHLLAELYERMIQFQLDGFQAVRPLWEKHALSYTKPVTVVQNRQRVTGIMKGIETDGTLLLEAEDGTVHSIVSGDIEGI
ncbi:biotin--[acetyl-CoA-carboxylase] ligase [Bacillus daqingensis]|uniref:Bifunctional ligase/repressor BirA n=1 Tax=Bacillus daqingensis TaxID=872396 RepID=A0ABV9NR23_9BACI